jgi:hypothetical protein
MQENYSHKEREEELRDAPLLQSIGNKNPFDAPEGYFDSLHAHIQDRLQVAHKPWIAHISQTAWVVMFLLVIGAGFLFKYYEKPVQQPTASHTEVTIDDLLNSGYYTQLEEELLSESLAESSTSSGFDDMEDFLIESADESLITNEL